MNQRKYFAGIDIGTTKIVAIIGCENQYGKLEILCYGKEPRYFPWNGRKYRKND